jgi:hypothetical protein
LIGCGFGTGGGLRGGTPPGLIRAVIGRAVVFGGVGVGLTALCVIIVLLLA